MLRVLAIVMLGGCHLLFPVEGGPPGPDDAPSDAGTEPGICPTKATALVDPFAPTTLRPNWVLTRSALDEALQANVMANGLELVNGIPGRVGVISDTAYDLLDARFSIAVRAESLLGEDLIQFGVAENGPKDADTPDETNSASWKIRLVDNVPQLIPATFENGGENEIDLGVPYVEGDHRYLGFARVGAVTQWLVSPNGVDFKALFERSLPWVRDVRPFMAHHRSGGANPSRAFFTELNGPPGTIAAAACPTSSLHSELDEDDPFTWHRRFEVGCKVELAGGHVTITPDLGATAFTCEYRTTGVYDLIDHAIEIEVGPTNLDANGDAAYLDLTSFEGTTASLELRHTGEGLRLRGLVQQPQVPAVFDLPDTGERFWRIAGSLDLMGKQQLTWSTSTDGKAYQERKTFSGLAGFEQTRVVLGGIGSNVNTTSISFARVGAPP